MSVLIVFNLLNKWVDGLPDCLSLSPFFTLLWTTDQPQSHFLYHEVTIRQNIHRCPVGVLPRSMRSSFLTVYRDFAHLIRAEFESLHRAWTLVYDLLIRSLYLGLDSPSGSGHGTLSWTLVHPTPHTRGCMGRPVSWDPVSPFTTRTFLTSGSDGCRYETGEVVPRGRDVRSLWDCPSLSSTFDCMGWVKEFVKYDDGVGRASEPDYFYV